jgi:protein-disulfide isomerase
VAELVIGPLGIDRKPIHLDTALKNSQEKSREVEMRKLTKEFIKISMLAIITVQPIWAENIGDELDVLREEVTRLKGHQETIESEIAEIRTMLEQALRNVPSQTAFQPAKIRIEGVPFLGNANATITFIEYTDYQCSFCGRHYDQVLPALIAKFVDSGKMKYVIRANPLTSIHSLAMDASQAAFCADDQDSFWEMHDILFNNRDKLASEDLKAYGEKLGLDAVAYENCLDEGKYSGRVMKDIASGQSLGVRGTPAFFVGKTDGTDPNVAVVTAHISGARDLNTFSRIIGTLLSEVAEGDKDP